jgi:hypothetical protein
MFSTTQQAAYATSIYNPAQSAEIVWNEKMGLQ